MQQTFDRYDISMDDGGIVSILLNAQVINYENISRAELTLNGSSLHVIGFNIDIRFNAIPPEFCSALKITRRCDLIMLNERSVMVPLTVLRKEIKVLH